MPKRIHHSIDGIPGGFVERALQLICENGPYRSAVILCGDMWPGKSGSELAYPFVEQAVVELNEMGFVVYAEGDYLVPVKIRATTEGYDAAGMPPRVTVFGPKQWRYDHRETPQPNWFDLTDFRYHPDHAIGGEVETMPIAAHIAKYPDHPHGGKKVMSQTTLPKTMQSELHRAADLAPAVKHPRVAEMLRDHRTNSDISKATGVSGSTIKRVAMDIGLVRGARGTILSEAREVLSDAEESHKMKVLRLIVDDGPFHYEQDLTSRVQTRPDWHIDGHNIVHILHALRKSNKIGFVQGNGSEGTRLRRIEATAEGRKTIRMADAESHRQPNQNEKPPSAQEQRLIDDTPPTRAINEAYINGKANEHAAMIAAGIPVGVIPNGGDTHSLTRLPPSAVPGAPAPAAEQPAPVATPAPARDSGPVTIERYPVIMALLRRKEKIEAGARNLEEAGLEDLALAALAQIDNLTDLEKEVVRFVVEGRNWEYR